MDQQIRFHWRSDDRSFSCFAPICQPVVLDGSIIMQTEQNRRLLFFFCFFCFLKFPVNTKKPFKARSGVIVLMGASFICCIGHTFCMFYSNELNSVVVTTTPVNQSFINQPLAISFILKDGLPLHTSHKFVYRPDPTFKNIEPRNHLIVCVT